MNYRILKEIIENENITKFSIVNLKDIGEFDGINEEVPCELSYLKNEKRKSIALFYPDARSVIVCLFQYWHKEKNYLDELKKINDPIEYLGKRVKNIDIIKNIIKPGFKISRYALVDEYHKKIRDYLMSIFEKIKRIDSSIEGKIFVDTSPVMEKIVGYISGLGFIGKNTLLINPDLGSYFFISGIILNKEIEGLPQVKRIENMCGSCRRCIESCPTEGLSDFYLSPERCISFWTTHNKVKEIPSHIYKNNEYIYGCDLCQEVCPYNLNIKKFKTIF